MRPIGLHLRVNTTLKDVIDNAENLGAGCFQCFFIFQPTLSPLVISKEEKLIIRDCINAYHGVSYLHASYWINLARLFPKKHSILERELKLARALGFKYVIAHPGAVKNKEHKQQGIKALAETLNNAIQKNDFVTFVLENAAHGGKAIGGDLSDFEELRSKLRYPDRVKFCIDTAHAFVYGYDIRDVHTREEFIILLENTIGIENIILIHLNDTINNCGSRQDQHSAIGKGIIGEVALKQFVLHSKLKNIPLILELPILPESEQIAILEQVKSWHH